MILTEKPELGRAIAEALPGQGKKNGNTIQIGEYTICWALGHLLRNKEPEEIDPNLKKWNLKGVKKMTNQEVLNWLQENNSIDLIVFFSMEQLTEEQKRDKTLMLELIKKNGETLQFASEELRKDKEMMLEAVKNFAWALGYAIDTFQNDKEVVLQAV